MNPTKRWATVFLFLTISLVISACWFGEFLGALITPQKTVTPTFAPTPTALPTLFSTPTQTILPTPTEAPLKMGWTGYTQSGFYLELPDSWQAIDINKEGFDAIIKELNGLNATWAQKTAQMLSSEEMQKMLKFFAMDPLLLESDNASANLVYQSLDSNITSYDICREMPAVYQQMGIELLSSECGLEINGLDAAKLNVIIKTDAQSIKEVQYAYILGNNMWTLTLAAVESSWSIYESLYDEIANTFKLVSGGGFTT